MTKSNVKILNPIFKIVSDLKEKTNIELKVLLQQAKI